jgi:hypothetical protein
MTIRTNRDLYPAITELVKQQGGASRSLETYLLALWSLTAELENLPDLSPTELFGLLSSAYSAPAAPFQDAWRGCDDDDTLRGFLGWKATLQRQIADLREMHEQGILQHELRYFGDTAPSGHSWYNFDPGTFLECAAAGTFGGWSREADDPLHVIDRISWDVFREFLYKGQLYE